MAMDEAYHYPPELFNLLVDTIPMLFRSKSDVILFFRGAGVPESGLSDLKKRVDFDRNNIRKYEIAKTVLQRINEQGDSGLYMRREVIKRVVEFEDFSTCWDDDQLKAKGLVADIRKIVNVKDSFTRMNQERERERDARAAIRRAEIRKVKEKQEKIQQIKRDFYVLFTLDDKPQERGRLLEKVLNRLFDASGILIKQDFQRRTPDVPTVLEQIDGIISFDGHVYLVEMKWVKDPIGVADIAQHLVRLFGREGARGIFISSNGYTEPAINQCREALSWKTNILCTLQEFVFLLEQDGDLKTLLSKKVDEAIGTKHPSPQVPMILNIS